MKDNRKEPPAFRELLAVRDIAELGDCSERKAQEIIRAETFPQAIVLGPRTIRWHREEVVTWFKEHAPRRTSVQEPRQLSEARKARKARAA